MSSFSPKNKIFFDFDNLSSPLRKRIFFLSHFCLRDGCQLLIPKEDFDLFNVFKRARDQDFLKKVDPDRNLAQLFFQGLFFSSAILIFLWR